MDGYAIVNLRDLLNEIGENETKSILSTFSCHLNLELEKFIRFKAIEFSKRRFASTHLVLASHRGKPVIVGYFAIANKAIVVPTKMLSHRLRSRISLFADERTMLPGENKPTEYIIPAPLIGQLGKNFDNGYNKLISGDALLKMAVDKVRQMQNIGGGNIVYLECEDKEKLVKFYSDNGFVNFGKRCLEKDERETQAGEYYLQMLKYLE